MSNEQSKWYAPLLASFRTLLGLDQNATEQEIHQKVMESEDLMNEAKASIRTDVEGEFQAKADNQKAKIDELQEQIGTLTEERDNAVQEVADLKSQLETATDTIETLKKQDDGQKTEGKTGGQDKGEKNFAFENNPLTQKAREINKKYRTKQDE